MLYTSYFGMLRSLPENVIPIAICRSIPSWYSGLQYLDLAPDYETIQLWKRYRNADLFMRKYYADVLDGVDPDNLIGSVVNSLPEQVQENIRICNCPIWENRDVSIAFMCYEKSQDFCHRHILAAWLEKNGIKCEEYVV